MAGPGRLLGYRAMTKRIRMKYNLNVSREKVYNMMYLLDADNLAARGGVGKKKGKRDVILQFQSPTGCTH